MTRGLPLFMDSRRTTLAGSIPKEIPTMRWTMGSIRTLSTATRDQFQMTRTISLPSKVRPRIGLSITADHADVSRIQVVDANTTTSLTPLATLTEDDDVRMEGKSAHWPFDHRGPYSHFPCTILDIIDLTPTQPLTQLDCTSAHWPLYQRGPY